MTIVELQQWVSRFHSSRCWTEYGPFIRTGFLMEEWANWHEPSAPRKSAGIVRTSRRNKLLNRFNSQSDKAGS